MPSRNVSQRPLPEELPVLLKERQLTLRALARKVGGLDHAYLSRMIGGRVSVNVGHARRIAVALGLRGDYFPEVREAAVIRAIQDDPRLREAIYSKHVKKPQK